MLSITLNRKYATTRGKNLKSYRLFNVKKWAIGVLMLLMPMLSLWAQKTRLEYTIIKSGQPVGKLYFSRSINKDTVVFKAESNVNTRLILPIKVMALEIANYKNGVLQHSSLYRKVNAKEKVNRRVKLNKSHYIINQNNSNTILKVYPIRHSIVGIFCEEPVNINRLYSDNYQQLIPIRKVIAHKYRADFPDGSYNYYYFKNGICTRVEVHHTLYSLQFVLNKII